MDLNRRIKRGVRKYNRHCNDTADVGPSVFGGGLASLSITAAPAQVKLTTIFSRFEGTSSTIGIKLIPLPGTDTMVINGTSRIINTRMHVINGMDNFKRYSLEELRFFDCRLLEITAGFGLKILNVNEQLIYPQGIDEEDVLGEKHFFATKHMCVTAIKEYEDFSLEELRYSDLIVVQLEQEKRTYLKTTPTPTDNSNWPYPIEGFRFGFTEEDDNTTLTVKIALRDETGKARALAGKSSNNVVDDSADSNSEKCSGTSDEAKVVHRQIHVTDSSLSQSFKNATSSICAIQTSEQEESDDVLSDMKRLFVSPNKDAASSSTALDKVKHEDGATVTSPFAGQSITTTIGSVAFGSPKVSSSETKSASVASSMTNVISPLSSSNRESQSSNNAPGLFSRLLATDAPFSFKCVPNFSDATSGNDKTLTLNRLSSAVPTTPCSLTNAASAPTLSPFTSAVSTNASLDFKPTLSSVAPDDQVQAKETYTKERIPEVVELCVGGTHRYTTLLATLTQEKAGHLAAMFLGEKHLHVLKDGAYFVDGDGESFQLILEYLRDERLPDMNTDSRIGTSRCESLLLKSYQTAVKFGLHGLVYDLDQYVPIQRYKELATNKELVEFYCKQILWALDKKDLRQNGKYSMLLKSTKSAEISACCDHVCQFAPADSVVHLTRDFSKYILSLLCQRLHSLGNNVAADEARCLFKCPAHGEADSDRKECTSRRLVLIFICNDVSSSVSHD